MAVESGRPTVLVAGSRTNSLVDSRGFDEFCVELGKWLSIERFTIIAGSLRSTTADFHVLRGGGRSERPSSVRFIRPVAGSGDIPLEMRLEGLGEFPIRHELYPGGWSEVRQHQVEPADFVVVIGGGKGTLNIAREAQRQSKPIFPIPAFGGAAESVYSELNSAAVLTPWGEPFVRDLHRVTPKSLVRLIAEWWKGSRVLPTRGEQSESGSAGIGIICPLEEELQAVIQRIPDGHWRLEPPRPDFIQTFYTGEVGEHRIALASPTKMGRVHAAVTTADLVRCFSPRYVMLVGIAGGNPAEGVALGDLIVADQIIDYELQKLRPDGPEIRQQAYTVNQRLLAESQALRGWEAGVVAVRPENGIAKRHVGPTLCGDKVIAVRKVLETLGVQFPKVVAVEMESAGCALACLRFDSNPGFFMVRGVSDLADENKQTKDVVLWRSYACDVAAAFAMQLLRRIPPQEPQAR